MASVDPFGHPCLVLEFIVSTVSDSRAFLTVIVGPGDHSCFLFHRKIFTPHYTRVIFDHSDITFDHSDITFDHSDITFDHSDIVFDHSDVGLDHSDITFDHSDVTFDHLDVSWDYSSLTIDHPDVTLDSMDPISDLRVILQDPVKPYVWEKRHSFRYTSRVPRKTL